MTSKDIPNANQTITRFNSMPVSSEIGSPRINKAMKKYGLSCKSRSSMRMSSKNKMKLELKPTSFSDAVKIVNHGRIPSVAISSTTTCDGEQETPRFSPSKITESPTFFDLAMRASEKQQRSV